MNLTVLVTATTITLCSFFALLAKSQSITTGQEPNIIISANKLIASVQPTMWGIFFEEINFSADGGLYAELVKNRSFEFPAPLKGWTVYQNKSIEGSLLVLNSSDTHSTNPRYLRITKSAMVDSLSLVNEGFRGMGIKKGLRYDFSVLLRIQKPGLRIHIELLNSLGGVIGNISLTPKPVVNIWNKEAVSFISTDTAVHGKLKLSFECTGTLDVDMISLFPSDTWKNRPGGMRADMVKLLADMKPGFLRFPGGCIVEGRDLATRYQWKKTLGPVEGRQLMVNRWNTEVAEHQAPDYYQTFGLGFSEYFQLAEDLGAEPLPILNCGMACQFNTAEAVPVDGLDVYVQDALDLIEFANGNDTTKWGRLRASLGHSAPYNLKMIGVGNENWGPQYVERLEVFSKAIKKKYPDLKIINSSGTDPDGDRFVYLNSELRKIKADIIDEHYYRPTGWFLSNAKRYDNYPRTSIKIFAGEYAAHNDIQTNTKSSNNISTAIAEAAFMTGLERNAAVVTMASYAPLFAHAEAWQCPTNLIWENNVQSYGTANYYVQKLFSLNKGTDVVPALRSGRPLTGQDKLYVSAVTDRNTNDIIIKVVNASAKPQTNVLELKGIKKKLSEGLLTTLASNNLYDANSFTQPLKVAPKESIIKVQNHRITLNSLPYSLSVIRVKLH